MSGLNHGAGTGLFIFGTGQEEVGSFDDVGMHGCGEHYQLSVVFLGIFVDLFANRSERVHW